MSLFGKEDTFILFCLSARIGVTKTNDLQPLTPKEMTGFAAWLQGIGTRPRDLLDTTAAEELLSRVRAAGLTAERVTRLLERSGFLAEKLAEWGEAGIRLLNRWEEAYPQRLLEKLGDTAPALLYVAGPEELLPAGGLAMIGSRSIGEREREFTRTVAQWCAQEGIQVVSGGAKGVDSESMTAALETGGGSLGVLAGDLLRSTRKAGYRKALDDRRLALVTPFHPESGFSVGNAMYRNKLIYVLADYALAVRADKGKGGTWSGATDNLQQGWTPLWVFAPRNLPEGNQALVEKGARPLEEGEEALAQAVRIWRGEEALPPPPQPNDDDQMGLF